MQEELLSSDKVISTPGLQRPSRSGERLKSLNQMPFFFFFSPSFSSPASPRKVCLFSLSSSGYKETRDCQKALETASALRATLPRTLQFLPLQARAAGLH